MKFARERLVSRTSSNEDTNTDVQPVDSDVILIRGAAVENKRRVFFMCSGDRSYYPPEEIR